MSYRFTLAAVVAATALSGCAARSSDSAAAPVSQASQSSDTPVSAPSQPAPMASSAPADRPVTAPASSAAAEQPAVATQPAPAPITAPGAVTESTASTSAPAASSEVEGATASETASSADPALLPTPVIPAAPTEAPDPASRQAAASPAPAEAQEELAPFSKGPTQIDVAHVVTRADDGSSIVLTIDGTEAGVLKRGEKRALFVEAGKHKVGGYVQTLFGFGRVTIPAVEITTAPGKVKNVAYSVTRTRPGFKEGSDSNTAG